MLGNNIEQTFTYKQSPKETIQNACQIPLSSQIRKLSFNLSSAEFAPRVLKVKVIWSLILNLTTLRANSADGNSIFFSRNRI